MSEVKHRLILKRGREAPILAHHPWVFSGAVDRVESLPEAADGEVCDLFDAQENWLARGTLHRSSQIICRILTWRPEEIDSAFFLRRCREAHAMREQFLDPAQTDAYRLINAEADRLPGLIVDRYGQALVTQCLTSGMARLQEEWCEALQELLSPDVIVDRTEHARRDPGLAGRNQALRGVLPQEPVWFRECGHRFRPPTLPAARS